MVVSRRLLVVVRRALLLFFIVSCCWPLIAVVVVVARWPLPVAVDVCGRCLLLLCCYEVLFLACLFVMCRLLFDVRRFWSRVSMLVAVVCCRCLSLLLFVVVR